MTVAFYMNCVSTHQLPLAREVDARVDEFVYVYESTSGQAYQQINDAGGVVVKKIGVEKRCRCRKVGDSLKVLWVGRMLDWKRVGDITRAVDLANDEVETSRP